MIIAICLDDHNGFLFNHRRQSQDRALRADLLREAGQGKLWLNPYSAGQFPPEQQEKLEIREDFLDNAPAGVYCFVENQQIAPHLDRVERLLVYRWNRVYPSDHQLDLTGWRKAGQQDFAGYSHPKLTKEIYIR